MKPIHFAVPALFFLAALCLASCGKLPTGPANPTPTPTNTAVVSPTATFTATPSPTSSPTQVPYYPVTITASDTYSGSNVKLTWENFSAISGSLSFVSPGSATTVVSWAEGTTVMARVDVSPSSSYITLVVATPFSGPVTSTATLQALGAPSGAIGEIWGILLPSSPLTVLY